MMASTGWYCRVNDWKLWAFFEDLTPNIYILGVFLSLEEWIRSGFNLGIGVYVLTAVIGLAVVQLVSKKYRSYGWYKTGKKGFGFFFTNMVVFLILALVGVIIYKNYLIAVIWTVLGLLSLTGLFILGEVFDDLLVASQRRDNEKQEKS